ncbi:AI-2E family transporter [Flavobacterium aquicola]|uniref:Putative PurR-regulated permease PerM n=1 Tax=Flavobacterium aquicola TaxID=1682742 RepID=A0A3E0EV03_9FLAO|nr:AI-2E family transporter [Flavobacterium aquicola]REH02023.1 putative PurR-regulated permease PerM [Flavobacterium aquicola]
MNLNNTDNHFALDLLGSVLIVFIAYMLQDFLIPLFFAIILSVLIYPIVQYFESTLCFNRILSITIAITIFVSLAFTVFILIGFQFEEIVDKSDTYYKEIEQKISPLVTQTEKTTGIHRADVIEDKQLEIKEIAKQNSTGIMNFIATSGSILGDFILTPLYMFLFLLYRNFLVSFLYKTTEKVCHRTKMRNILSELYKVQRSYLLGLLIVMTIVGILNSLGLLLLGIEHAFFFGFLASLLLLIPYIGIVIGSLLPALIALATKDSYWYSIGVIGIFGFIQFLEGNFITPKITGSKVSLNVFASILSLILFSMLWGIPGMILALPVTASLKVIFDNSEKLKPIGFLLGEAKEKYFSNKAKNRLKIWKRIRLQNSKI